MMMKRPKSHDAYLSAVKGPRRATLKKLRQTIHEVLPSVEECVSYNIPAFKVGTAIVGGYLATQKGCSYYPFSGRTLKTLAAALKAYEGTRGSLHFAADKPLPKALVRKLVRARLAEVAERSRK